MSYYRQFPYKNNQLRIYINNYKDKMLQGIASFGIDKKSMVFQNIISVILAFDSFIDSQNFPQASTERRTFNNHKLSKKEVLSMEKNNEVKSNHIGKPPIDDKAVFIVEVDYRQNATWQGSVVWVEANEKKQFRSALELIMLMTSALDSPSTESFTKVAKEI
ncbi:MAG: hypothetical protein RSB05_05420 [Clostridiales bacterium]